MYVYICISLSLYIYIYIYIHMYVDTIVYHELSGTRQLPRRVLCSFLNV